MNVLALLSRFECTLCILTVYPHLLQVCIAFAFAVSTSMEKTKLAKAIADIFVALSKGLDYQLSNTGHANRVECTGGLWFSQVALTPHHPTIHVAPCA